MTTPTPQQSVPVAADTTTNVQTFFKYNTDIDFTCESEYMTQYGNIPVYKKWTAFYRRNAPKIWDNFSQFIKDLSEAPDNKLLHQKRSDVTNFYYERVSTPSYEQLYFLEAGEEKILISYLCDADQDIRILIFSNLIEETSFKELFNKFVNENAKFIKIQKKRTEPQISIIKSTPSGFDLVEFDVKSFPKKELATFINDHYNDDFSRYSEHILKSIAKTNHGLFLLHGEPGTGKTNYIRYMLNKIKDKRMIYVPPELVGFLSSPQFVDFVMENKNSVFIIEDAEAVLEARENTRNSAVNNILNFCDGLIGEAVQAQFVCTFNCEFNRIDPALKRPGRLIADYKFNKLSIEKSIKLGQKLYGKDNFPSSLDRELTLAEIYTWNDEFFAQKEEQKNPVGFRE